MADQMIETYLAEIAANGNSRNTLLAYRVDLEQLARDINPHGAAWGRAYMPDAAARWRETLRARGYAVATLSRREAAARSFAAWLVRRGALPADPWDSVRPLAVGEQAPDVLPADAVARLLAAVDAGRGPFALRDGILLHLLARTGLQISEVMGLHVADVQEDGVDIGADRFVPIDPDLRGRIREYVETTRGAAMPWGPLLLNHHGEPLTRQGSWLIVKGYARRAGVRGSARLLRNTAAARMFAEGATVEDVRQAIGVVNQSTAQRYAGAARRVAA